jgi:hypothetical protein
LFFVSDEDERVAVIDCVDVGVGSVVDEDTLENDERNWP